MRPRALWWSTRPSLLSEFIEHAPDWEWSCFAKTEFLSSGHRGPHLLVVDYEFVRAGETTLPWKVVPEALRSRKNESWLWIQVLPRDTKRALDWRIQCAEAGCHGFISDGQARTDWLREFRLGIQSSSDPVLWLMRRVEAVSGVQLPEQKRSLVESRLVRRALKLGHRDLEEYLGYFLAHSQDEMVEVISGVTTHTTHFFREPKHFEFLQREALPKILSDRRAIRVWSAACSTGQEPVSIAICLDELARGRPATAFSAAIPTFSWSVLATDLDSQSLKVASRAIYSAHELEGIPRKQLVDNFDPGTGELLGWWRLKDELFRQIQFQQWNLLDPVTPVREVDILFLRNVLIYFRQEEITSVLAKLGDCLAPGGYLFVGHSESFVALGHSLELVAAGVYRKSKGR